MHYLMFLLIPYVNTTTNNSVNVLTPNFSGDFDITGNTTPNTTVYAQIGSDIYSVTSGAYSIPVTNQKDLTVSNKILIYSQTSPGYYVHPEGANPNSAVLMFNINGVNFGITFDGLVNGLNLWYQTNNRYFANYETPWFTSQESTLNLKDSLSDNSQLTFKMTYSNGQTTTNTFDLVQRLP